MSARTLFLAWREPESRRSYPIGRLDADGDPESYRFRYTRGALRAEREAGLPRTVEFPCADKEYRSSGLFPMFGNRVISPRRPDRAERLCELGLGENADPIDILSANEGLQVTDAYRVFPKLVKKDGGNSSAASSCTAGGASPRRPGGGSRRCRRGRSCVSRSRRRTRAPGGMRAS